MRFVTDSPTLAARWTLRFNTLALKHMPATGLSGIDLYARPGASWGWVGVGIPEKVDGNEATLVNGAPSGAHEYMLYFPLYNGVESVEIGVKPGSTLAPGPPYEDRRAKPMLFWGSSILQGGCASRPGLAYPSILGRRMQRPVINLGFSGNRRMDPPVVDLIARLDVSIYVIDCAPNMDPALISERTEPLVRTLRHAHLDTPIVLVENIPYEKGWFLDANRDAYESKNTALRAAYERLPRISHPSLPSSGATGEKCSGDSIKVNRARIFHTNSPFSLSLHKGMCRTKWYPSLPAGVKNPGHARKV